jgi:hypothetical protein
MRETNFFSQTRTLGKIPTRQSLKALLEDYPLSFPLLIVSFIARATGEET